MARDQFVIQVAATVNEMFGEGKTDPSADEIAKAHFPDKALAPEIVESVRKRLHRIRDVLETAYDLPVYLLSYIYYQRFRSSPPVTDADARRCLPGAGIGSRVEGIRIHTNGDSDLVYQAMLDQSYSSGSGKTKKASDRVLTAVTDRRLNKTHARSIMRRGFQRAEPENIALARQVLSAVPTKKNQKLIAEKSIAEELMVNPKGKAKGAS